MLSRRHLRIKVLQALYAFFQSGNNRLDIGEKQLLSSIDKIFELYIHLFSFLIEIFSFAENRMEDAKKKYIPTDEDLHPNTKFIENKFIAQFSQNRQFRKHQEALKVNWADEGHMFRSIYKKIREGKEFAAYMQTNDSSYEADKEFVVKILKKYISDFESLENYFEDKSIFWATDYYTAIWMVMKTVKPYLEEWDEFTPLPAIFKTANDEENEDREFVITLFRKTIVHKKEYEDMIEQRAQNWEIERIASMDKFILEMALAELIEIPSIPVKVSLNEYIELAKIFSTAKSRIFINGILDKLISDLVREEKIQKTGRGLME